MKASILGISGMAGLWPFRFTLCACLLFAALMAQAADTDTFTPLPQARTRTVVEWTFDRAGDLQGWRPNADFANGAVADGALTGRGDGPDPVLELQPLLDIPASPWQQLEIRIRADHDGTGEFFWSNTTQGRYGGFSQDKSTRFNIIGDGQWRVYRLLPYWQSEGKIVRLRFDPYAGATFAIDFIRIVEVLMPAASDLAEYDFSQGPQGWQAINGAQFGMSSNGLALLSTTREGLLLAPPLHVPADQQTFVSVVVAARQGQRATLFFATENAPGLHSHSFAIQADGREHCYNLDMLVAPNWRGRIIALALRLSDAPVELPSGSDTRSSGPMALLRSVTVGAEPAGPPDLEVVSFAMDEALPRAGVPVILRAVITNRGGQAATNLQAELRLPLGVRMLASPTNGFIKSVGFDEEVTFDWILKASSPACAPAEVRISSGDGVGVVAQAMLNITAPVAATPSDYVPKPQPVRGPCEVGVYYFPGWRSASQWHPLERFPERKPVLGWYREGNPELADWHIKWAVEHGITFFAYDWYWSQGTRQLEHALHDGYFQARYHALLKFCLLWANHNAPNTSSAEDSLAVTRYWIENYFRRPEYLLVDGKPLVIIFSTDRLTADLGSARVKEIFATMRAECQRAGLPGLYLMANVADAGQARAAAAEGYDAVTAYNWPGMGLQNGELQGPFETLLEGYRRNWLHIIEQSPIPLALPICGGWDSRPWHGDNDLVRFGRTPELFRRHLEDAKRTLGLGSNSHVLTNLVLIEAWNEWGEGSYIEPHREFGFGYLDAVRHVFTDAPQAHVDLTPADLHLGPYDVPPQDPTQTAWDFAQGAQGWENTMDLTHVRVAENALTAETTGRDPAFFGPPMRARAREFSTVVVRMKLQRLDGEPIHDFAQLFWRTDRLPESEANSTRFDLSGDGQWHEYRIRVAQSPRWRGWITRLRLDPGNQAGVRVQLAAIRLER
jgi:Glycosyltransferase WbsX